MDHADLSELGIGDDVKNVCACFQLRKAARAITQLYDGYIHKAGVTPNQFSLLMVAYQAGELSPSEMARIAVLDKTTLTRNLRLLEKQGLLETTPSQTDRRAKVIRITPAGIETLRRVMPHWEAAQKQLAESLGSGNFDRLMASLEQVIARSRSPASLPVMGG